MFKWISRWIGGPSPLVAPAPTTLDLAILRGLEKAVVFKHSRSCPVSWAASSQVRRFQNANPAVPVYMVTVQDDPELSRAIEQQTGIPHESPQVIIFRGGEVADSASHQEVTAQNLSSMLS